MTTFGRGAAVAVLETELSAATEAAEVAEEAEAVAVATAMLRRRQS